MKSITLVDGNHIGMWASAGGDGKLSRFFRIIRQIKETIPGNITVLWDGFSWRHGEYCAYKANRDKSEALVSLKNDWKAVKGDSVRLLDILGIRQMKAKNYEADDLAGMICKSVTDRKINLITADRDWAQLYEKDRIIWIDIKGGKRIQEEEMFEIITGCKTVEQFVQTKALCGDAGDNIPSVGDFGPKTAKELFEKFPSVRDAINCTFTNPDLVSGCSKRLASFLDEPEKIAKYERNLRLVDLTGDHIPKPEGLYLTKPTLDQEKFSEFNARHLLVRRQDEVEWCSIFKE